KALKEAEVPSMIYYPRGIHQQTAYADRMLPDGFYSHTVATTHRVLNLPMHPYMAESQVDEISHIIITFVNCKKR
ncbi:MAG: DegT/DnrJ/EryC1/StrS family aminotransferase, partial [Acinetobacter sp.]